MAVNFAVNYLAVVAAAFAAVVIGILYYGVAGLGDRLARMSGITPLSGPPSPTQFAIGIVLGVLVWLGFGATLKAAQVAFERRSWSSWLLTGVHDLIVQIVMAAIVTVWR